MPVSPRGFRAGVIKAVKEKPIQWVLHHGRVSSQMLKGQCTESNDHTSKDESVPHFETLT